MAPPDPGGRKTDRAGEAGRCEGRRIRLRRNATASAAQTQPEAADIASPQGSRRAATPNSRSMSAAPIRSAACARCGAGCSKSNRGAGDVAPDHRGEGRQQRARHAACGWSPGRSATPPRRRKSAPTLIESQRTCETTVFDGQQLAMKRRRTTASGRRACAAACNSQQSHRRSHYPKRAKNDESAAKPEPSTLSSIFGRDTPKQ